MPVIPQFLLKQLYTKGSLRADDSGCSFTLRNNLASGTITGLELSIDGNLIPPKAISVDLNQREIKVVDISAQNPISFDVNKEVVVRVAGLVLGPGTHRIEVRPTTRELGAISIEVQDVV